MEVKIRNLSPIIVSELDAQAKEKGLTRQEYLKGYIERLASSNLLIESETKYETILKKTLGIIDLNTKVINSFMEENLIDVEQIK
nr:hypothetical protein [Clostridioides sp.]